MKLSYCNIMVLDKDKKIPSTSLPDKRANSTTPERVADQETKKFEETSRRLKELKEQIPENDKKN